MPRLYFASPRDLPSDEVQPGVRRRLLAAQGATVAVSDLAPKTVVETHKHEGTEQVGLVLRGSLVMVIAGEQRILGVGDAYRVPPGAAHGARVFEEATQLVTIWTPPLPDAERLRQAL